MKLFGRRPPPHFNSKGFGAGMVSVQCKPQQKIGILALQWTESLERAGNCVWGVSNFALGETRPRVRAFSPTVNRTKQASERAPFFLKKNGV